MAKKTLEQLQETHSEMCATAADLGMTVPEDLTIDFDTAEMGATVVSNLDALLRKFQAGINAEDAGNKVVATDEEKVQAAPTKKKAAAKKVAVQAKPEGTANPADSPPEAVEEQVAKKAAKKAAGKKPAAKAKAAASKPKNGFDESAKISWGAKPNPAREGTGRHERIETVRKATGKTVKTFLAGKGNPTTLKNCVAAKLCTVS